MDGLRNQSSRVRQRGAVLIVALVCLFVSVTMVGALLEGTLRARRQLRAVRDLRQTELLVQAGIQRARYQYAQDREYQGETWNIEGSDMPTEGNATVTITNRDGQTRVVAKYAARSTGPIQRSRSFSSSRTDVKQ